MKLSIAALGVVLFGYFAGAQAAEEYPGRRLTVRIRRHTDLTADQIKAVVDGGVLPGCDRSTSVVRVYGNLYTGYATRMDEDLGQVNRLLNLAKLIHRSEFEEVGGFFDTLDNLYHYTCREMARWREKATTRGADKTQLAFREAHLCLKRARKGNLALLGRAYDLFGLPLSITNNKYGLPWQAEIIVEDGYDAGSATRDGSLRVARMALMQFSRENPLRPRTAQEQSLLERINAEIGPVSPARGVPVGAVAKEEAEASRPPSPAPSEGRAAAAVAGAGAGASEETPYRPKPLRKVDSKRRAQVVDRTLRESPRRTPSSVSSRPWDWDQPDESYEPSGGSRRTRRRVDTEGVDLAALHGLVEGFGDKSAASIAAYLGIPRALVEEARRFAG